MLGFVTDNLHDLYNRPQFIGRLVFPKHRVEPITFRTIITQNQKDEERWINYVTRGFMFGVRSGNIPAIMKRQRVLEAANRRLRNIGSFLVRRAPNGPNSQTASEPFGNN
jgi:hypothetical protein